MLNLDGLSDEDKVIIMSIRNPEPDLITTDDEFGGKLYLGNFHAATYSDLKKYGISVVIQISGEDTPPKRPGEYEYHCFTFGDNPLTDLEPFLPRAL